MKMKHLIEKYFEGQTTREEEQTLHDYFQSEHVEESLKPYQAFFMYLDHEKKRNLTVSEDFEDRLFKRIEAEEKTVQIQPRIRFLNIVRAVAAIGLVLLAVYFYLQPGNRTEDHVEIDWSKYEITDEQLALEETQRALLLLSSKLNKGRHKTVEEISKSESASKFLN